jgi:rhodanese-related sulfurtransferase
VADDTDLEPEQVSEKLGDGWQLVDVREDHERVAERIPDDSAHIALADLTSKAETISRETPVVFYCRTGSRSGMATSAFRASGWEAYNLRGGIEAWTARGLPVEQG